MEDDKEVIKKSIIIIALDNLINTYSDILEDKEIKLNPEERELAINIINQAKEILLKETLEVSNPVIQRPQWKKT